MLKSKWARLAVLSVLGLTLPVLAAVKKPVTHGKVATSTKSHVTRTATPVAKPSVKATSTKVAAKPRVAAEKKLTTTKIVRKSVKPLHAAKKVTKTTALHASKKAKSSKLSAKKPATTKKIVKSTPKTLTAKKSIKASAKAH